MSAFSGSRRSDRVASSRLALASARKSRNRPNPSASESSAVTSLYVAMIRNPNGACTANRVTVDLVRMMLADGSLDQPGEDRLDLVQAGQALAPFGRDPRLTGPGPGELAADRAGGIGVV